jgi:hypothetical protein
VQTENNRKMCKHIKDKEKLPFSDQLPLSLFVAKTVPEMKGNAKGS